MPVSARFTGTKTKKAEECFGWYYKTQIHSQYLFPSNLIHVGLAFSFDKRKVRAVLNLDVKIMLEKD